MTTNRQVRVAARPTGIPQAEHFEIAEVAMARVSDGAILVRNRYLSVEPAMRGWLANQSNYSAPVPIGSVMRALAVGIVVESRHPAYVEGDAVLGWFGWQEYAMVGPESVIRKIEEADLPLSLSLGVLGLNGVTAYLALEQIGAPRVGETVLVSTAAGAVGSAVGQIAKLRGCRTVGITGGPVKTRLCLDAFGYDAAIDYKTGDLNEAIADACPDGVNVYFDNTAGTISDTVLQHIAVGARVIVCGTAAIARWDPIPLGPRVERQILTRRARMAGFVIFDHMAQFSSTVAKLADLVRDGKLCYREEILDGIEQCPGAIADLYRGANLGKRLIRLGD